MSQKDVEKPLPEQGSDEGEEPESDERVDEPTDPLEKAEQERAEYLANWQRARADFQNLKRRTLEDIAAAVSRERATLLEETLTVLDYLDMALASPCESEDARNLQVGVRMTRDHLWSMLERQDVQAIDTEGAFDPTLHQAVATVETEDAAPGDVVEVVRPGYKLGDQVLRYAQVKVAASATDAPEAPSAGESPGEPPAEDPSAEDEP